MALGLSNRSSATVKIAAVCNDCGFNAEAEFYMR
jgi:hypothetical protein